MSNAVRELHDYLAKSPSVIYPEDVLAYLPAIEAENAKLRELCERCAIELYVNGNVTDAMTEKLLDDIRELGVEVDE